MKFEEQLKTINEGLWDRTKARASGAVGAVKGAGQQIAGGIKGAVAGATGNIAGAAAAAQQGKQGAAKGQISKIESYKSTAQKKINKLSEEIFNDLKKLGIDIKLNPNAANGFTGQLNKGFNDLINTINTGANPVPATAPAPAPASKIASKATPPPLTASAPATRTPTASAPTPPAPASTTPTPMPAASTKTAMDKGIASTPSTPTATAPISDEQIVADLNAKKAESYKDNNSLIMLAKQRAGEQGIGTKTGAPKDGVEFLKQELDPADPITQAKAALAKQYNIDPKKLVDLMAQVYTESRSVRKFELLINRLTKN